MGIKGTSVFIAQRFFFLFKSDLSIFDSSCEMVCVFLTAKTLGTLMHESKFRSSVLLWRKCKFCFSSKVIGSVRDGRIMPFYSLDLTEWGFFWRTRLQAGLAKGKAACSRRRWPLHTVLVCPFNSSSVLFWGCRDIQRKNTNSPHTDINFFHLSHALCSSSLN